MSVSTLHVYRGTTHAFEESVIKWFCENDHMGYAFWPNSNKIIRGVQHVVDNEVSVRNTDVTMKSAMLDLIWKGPWMKEIARLLPTPYLMSVEIHANSHTKKGNTHRDHHSHPVWIVVVPLCEEGNTVEGCGGTTVIDECDRQTILECEYNRFFIFPAHFLHHRQAAASVEFAHKRRTMFIIFTDVYKLAVEFMSTGRSLHTRALRKHEFRERKASEPFRMCLRHRA